FTACCEECGGWSLGFEMFRFVGSGELQEFGTVFAGIIIGQISQIWLINIRLQARHVWAISL
ncbi:MAG: hypothetical protein IJT12_06540, partial [Paludibacteraceae bacterium]|nr:hypothetical protein [Paludibacteraceae bacterium]